jgi:hypothetical protein
MVSDLRCKVKAFRGSGLVSAGMFDENWRRYGVKKALDSTNHLIAGICRKGLKNTKKHNFKNSNN